MSELTIMIHAKAHDSREVFRAGRARIYNGRVETYTSAVPKMHDTTTHFLYKGDQVFVMNDTGKTVLQHYEKHGWKHYENKE